MALVKDWLLDNPKYWMGKGQHGYGAYTAMGSDWGKGWTSRRNLFKDITLWSQRGLVTFRGMPYDSVFDHCIFKGNKCVFGNALQYSRVDDCTCHFSDQLAEIAYNSLYCHITNLKAFYDPSLGQGRTQTMGLFKVTECSQRFAIDNLSIKAATHAMAPNNKAIKLSSSNSIYRNLRLEIPKISDVIRICPIFDESLEVIDNQIFG